MPIFTKDENIVSPVRVDSKRDLMTTGVPELSLAQSLPDGDIVCSNGKCDYVGKPRKKRRRSLLIGGALMLVSIPVGLVYFAARRGHHSVCPRCGTRVA